MRSMTKFLFAASLAFASGLSLSASSASADYINVPSSGGQFVVGSYGGKVQTAFRAANGACTILSRYYGPVPGLLIINGTGGNDVIRIAAGPTPLCGRTFQAVNLGENGAIDVFAGGGHDWVLGKFRDAYGGTGNDVISGATYGEVQTLLGEGGNDYLYGSDESQLNGGSNDDVLCAQSGVTPYLFRGGSGFDQGCGPYDAVWNNDMEELDENCPAVCQIL